MENKSCVKCSNALEYKEGTSKKGNDYKGYFCTNPDCKADPVWVSDKGGQQKASGDITNKELQDHIDTRLDAFGKYLDKEFSKLQGDEVPPPNNF